MQRSGEVDAVHLSFAFSTSRLRKVVDDMNCCAVDEGVQFASLGLLALAPGAE